MTTTGLSVIITGGASGIGEAVARRVVAGGGHVGIADNNAARGAALAAELGARAHFIDCDASSEASVEAVHAALAARMPPINGLVASAAITPKARSAANVTVDAFWSIVDSHLRWTYISNRIVGLEMAKRGSGSIVNIASVLAFRSGPVMGYSEGKTAIMNLTQSLAVEWALNGVRVNAVAPGWVDTPFLDARRAKGNLADVAQNVPQARLIAPAEIAELIHFLLSPQSSAITGTTIPCDAGYLAGTGWAQHGGLPKASR